MLPLSRRDWPREQKTRGKQGDGRNRYDPDAPQHPSPHGQSLALLHRFCPPPPNVPPPSTVVPITLRDPLPSFATQQAAIRPASSVIRLFPPH
jgi:hypothetical protein